MSSHMEKRTGPNSCKSAALPRHHPSTPMALAGRHAGPAKPNVTALPARGGPGSGKAVTARVDLGGVGNTRPIVSIVLTSAA